MADQTPAYRPSDASLPTPEEAAALVTWPNSDPDGRLVLLATPLDERITDALCEEGFDEGDAENGTHAVLRVLGVWADVQAERERAHRKHRDTSMEALPIDDLTRLTVLMEEVGEVAREFNEARHRAHRFGWDIADALGPEERASLRAELVQVAAMAGAWADALTAPTAIPRPCRYCAQPISESRTYGWLHVGGWKMCGKRGMGGVAKPCDPSQDDAEATYGPEGDESAPSEGAPDA